MKILLIAILLSLFAFNHSLDPNKVVIAINCGGSEYVDPDGTEYISDDYYNGGTESDYGLQYDIQLTKDVELYQTERWSDKDLVYSLPFDVTTGKYVIILKFSEVYFAQPNEKVFDIGLGSKTIIKNLDIFENVGKAKAHDEYIEFEFKDNQNEIVNEAYDSKNKILVVKFLKGFKDNPKINAIVVLKGDIMDTEYAEKKKKLEEINKKRIQMMKKKSLILKKHDVDEEFDEAFELSTEEDIIKPKVESTLLSTLISTPGLYIIVSFLVFISLYIMLDNLESSSKTKKKLK